MPIFAGVIGAYTALRNHNEREEQQKKEKEQQKKGEEVATLLLTGKEENMIIGEKEKIEVYRIIRDPEDYKWEIFDKNNLTVCKGSNIAKCIENALIAISPKEISLTPVSVRDAIVNQYILLAKTDDKEKLQKDKEIMERVNKITEDMSKNLENEW